ncbi:MAG: formamidopyrimidine-DNA glycosylase [SAR324 cluster bacterium]|nr:formamidopyrimidine-DNA glycosylase [SAR324 cluster bacterium]
MPELPDITLYLEHLRPRIEGQALEKVRLLSPFLLRSVNPPLRDAEGKRVVGLRRLGKRIVIGLERKLFLVLHLMIAGRLQWRERGAKIPGRIGLAAFDFSSGTLLLTEAGSKRRASLHLVRGEAGLAEHDPGGLEVLEAEPGDFARVLAGQNHMVKRALTDPRLFSGIGNAYSDEILHRARLSPFKLAAKLEGEEVARLCHATREVMAEWIARLREEAGEGFPEKVTAFREEMAVHGRYGRPCPVCGAPVQRVVRASNEFNYCARCQTGGRVFADRALSRLLRKDWPRTLEELEQLGAKAREGS